MKLDGKRVLLTGASSGIGLALARALAARGAILAISSRSHERLEQVSEELASAVPGIKKPLPVACDVSDEGSVTNLIGTCIETLGTIDVLINNAGICVYGSVEKTPLANLQALLDVNFMGPVQAMLEVLPFMKRQGHGLIVNVSSVAALRGVPYLGAYGASKAALVTLSQSMRAELAGSGVRVMLVYPDYTESAIFENETKVGGGKRPEGPYAPTAEVAEAIVGGIEADSRELILSSRGKKLAVLSRLAPSFVERAMCKLADELRDEGE
ncbi:MAG: SDR family NAD(P)-dependent oxidoreductase [Candidatus Eisenbacteria bacterium]